MTDIPAPPPAPRSLWRKLTAAYAALLSWLLIVSRRDPDHPGHAADLLALHRAHPVLHLDRGDGALPLHLDDHDRRHARRAREHALRGRRLADAGAARRGGVRLSRASACWSFALVFVWCRHRVHRVRLVPHLRARRAAALAHPHRLADRRRHLDRSSSASRCSTTCASCAREAPHEPAPMTVGPGVAALILFGIVLLLHGAARAGRLRAGARLPADRCCSSRGCRR